MFGFDIEKKDGVKRDFVMPAAGEQIVANGLSFSMDCRKTNLTNNLLVVGGTGSGKTRSVVIPNLLQATGSYVVTDPKGNLYDLYGDYLRKKGYEVVRLDFVNPEKSVSYNPLAYMRQTNEGESPDVKSIAKMICNDQETANRTNDKFWNESSQMLLESVIDYFLRWSRVPEPNIPAAFELLGDLKCSEEFNPYEGTCMHGKFADCIAKIALAYPNDDCVQKFYDVAKSASDTARSIVISMKVAIDIFRDAGLRRILEKNDFDIKDIGRKKTAVFVVTSEFDRSRDKLVNIFFTQAMAVLCRAAEDFKDQSLPVPVRFIMDDFATNCKIDDFPRMISSVRSRNISVIPIIQAESQLKAAYGADWQTIINNCDTYLYLGGNDVDTAFAIAERTGASFDDIMHMPVGECWVTQRGSRPVHAVRFDLEKFSKIKMHRKEKEAKL